MKRLSRIVRVASPLGRRGALALRVVVSAALLGIVLAYADVGDVADAVRDGDWGWFAAGLALMGAAVVVGALRWWLLLEGAQIEVSARRGVRAFAYSMVLNILLPTAVAGDAVRTWVVGRESGRLLGAAAATVIDKLTALSCLFVLAWVAYALDRGAVPHSLVVVFAWVTAGLLAALAIAALVAAGVRPVLHRFPDRLAVMARESWKLVRSWAGSAKLVGSVLGLGVLYQLFAVIALILVGRTLGLELPFALAAVSTSIVLVATLIPVSVGGLGIREGGFVLLLGEAGIDAADATLISLLSAAAVLISGAGVAAAAYLYDAARTGGPEARSV
jgi:glycosyltransferase 2 family protein